ncbi:hypothetical protein [Rhodothermus marinus]|uniref:hypothetical protein n=1 Tax=Rhodothermus marinus TaxID=29549 RepID=UPI001651A0F2|nr:hypothetical protein [Rhodothermus marinus]
MGMISFMVPFTIVDAKTWLKDRTPTSGMCDLCAISIGASVQNIRALPDLKPSALNLKKKEGV